MGTKRATRAGGALAVGLILLDEGLATVDETMPFPGKRDFLRHQRRARTRRENAEDS